MSAWNLVSLNSTEDCLISLIRFLLVNANFYQHTVFLICFVQLNMHDKKSLHREMHPLISNNSIKSLSKIETTRLNESVIKLLICNLLRRFHFVVPHKIPKELCVVSLLLLHMEGCEIWIRFCEMMHVLHVSPAIDSTEFLNEIVLPVWVKKATEEEEFFNPFSSFPKQEPVLIACF